MLRKWNTKSNEGTIDITDGFHVFQTIERIENYQLVIAYPLFKTFGGFYLFLLTKIRKFFNKIKKISK